MGLFKSAAEILSQGHDLILRGDFSGACDKYNDAARRFSKESDTTNARLAAGYAAIAALASNQSNTDQFNHATRALRDLGDVQLKFGVRSISATQLSQETELRSEEIGVLKLQPRNAAECREKAAKLQNLATRYRVQVSGGILLMPELFNRQIIQGDQKANALMAEAEQALGESLVSTDPKAAAEHYQRARLWWTQAGRQDLAEGASSHVQAYGKAAACWFCGREVSGEGVHFLQMPSDLTDLLRSKSGESPLPSFDSSSGFIYACKGCHSAVFKMADRQALQRMTELEERVNAQIRDLRDQIERLRSKVSQIAR